MNTWEFMKETVRRWKTKEAPVRDPKKMRVKKLGQALKGGGGGDFEESPVDLEEISRAYHTDSYIKRAVDKYTDLMFKSGWDVSGRNEKASEYIWTRFKLMSEATGLPLDQLLYQIAYDLVLFGNAYVVKARQKGSQGGAAGVNAQGYTGKRPIAGYFVLPPTTVQVSRDDTGKILGYEQSASGGTAYTIKPEDMVHFTYKKPTGRAYGVPFIHNVLDDVKLLRQIEENVARLVYRNLFPLHVYQVGLDKPGFEATDEEIDEIREQIRDMPMDGGIVVPERHNISTVGAEGSALDAEPYLKYYRSRVFTGLGVSDSVMGIGDTANRSTSDNQSADLHDGVKEFQRAFTDTFQSQIVNELLFEGGYDPVLNPDDEVVFGFSEIELDAKIKKENHAVQLFAQNAITHEEMREMMGRDPVSDEGRLYFNMVTIATSQAQAELTQQQQAANNAGDNKDQPENQNGKRKSPKKPKREHDTKKVDVSESFEENSYKDLTEDPEVVTLNSELNLNSYLESMQNFWDSLRDDTVQMVRKGKSADSIQAFTVELTRQSLRSKNRQYIGQAMLKGLHSMSEEMDQPINPLKLNLQFATEQIIRNSEKYVDRLLDDINSLIRSAMKQEEMKDRIAKIIGGFNSNEYRLSFIAKTELYRAYNYGRATAAKEADYETVGVESHEGCKQCLDKQAEPVVLSDHNLLDAVPPHHPNCTCLVTLSVKAEEV